MLFGIMRRVVKENAVAERLLLETFVEAWKGLDEFDGTKSCFFVWLLQIAQAKTGGYSGRTGSGEPVEKKEKMVLGSLFSPTNNLQKQYSNY